MEAPPLPPPDVVLQPIRGRQRRGEDKTIFLACVSPLEKKWKKDRMKVRCSDHQRLDFFHPICIFLAILYFNLAFNIHFQGKLLNLLAKASSAQHHLSQYLMLHLILKHYTSLQYS